MTVKPLYISVITLHVNIFSLLYSTEKICIGKKKCIIYSFRFKPVCFMVQQTFFYQFINSYSFLRLTQKEMFWWMLMLLIFHTLTVDGDHRLCSKKLLNAPQKYHKSSQCSSHDTIPSLLKTYDCFVWRKFLLLTQNLLLLYRKEQLGCYKYFILCSTEEINSYRFWKTWRWNINSDRIFFFLIELSHSDKMMSSYINTCTDSVKSCISKVKYLRCTCDMYTDISLLW